MLPMPVIIDGHVYYEGTNLLSDQFFRALAEHRAVSTSQPSISDVTVLWEQVLSEHDELVYIPMSSGLSSACATAMILAKDYSERVFVVDNHRVSVSQKSSVMDALALREAGFTARRAGARRWKMRRGLRLHRGKARRSRTRPWSPRRPPP